MHAARKQLNTRHPDTNGAKQAGTWLSTCESACMSVRKQSEPYVCFRTPIVGPFWPPCLVGATIFSPIRCCCGSLAWSGGLNGFVQLPLSITRLLLTCMGIHADSRPIHSDKSRIAFMPLDLTSSHCTTPPRTHATPTAHLHRFHASAPGPSSEQKIRIPRS